jgi:phage tail-like protein
VWNFGSGAGSEVSLADFRKDVLIDLFNEAGQKVMSFKVYRCWPSEYLALGPLDANGTCVAIESITLQHEGWERDYEVTEPKEPTFTEPEK